MADDELKRNGRIDRRKFIGGLGAGVTAGLAGCPGPSETETPGGGESPSPTPSPTPTPKPGEIEYGGTPTIGMAVAPTTLNVLQGGSVYEFFIIDRVMGYGTAIHPDDASFQPWIWTDWTVDPSNVGTDQPTLTATMVDGLTFTDGEDATVEDYKFSVEYIIDQQPGGSITAAPFRAALRLNRDDEGNPTDDPIDPDNPPVEAVSDTEVEIYFDNKDQRWFTSILGAPFLPQHIWSDVADHTQYAPRNTQEGLVGCGAWVLEDFNWENWFELSVRRDWPVLDNDDIDWIRDDAPFVDGLRFEIFGSQSAMEQAVLNGDITTGFVAGGFTTSNAVKAQQNDDLKVHQAQDAGYNHISFNLRRVPFDDVAFRQFLNKVFDKQWVVDVPYRGIGAVAGDYVAPTALNSWRPPAPSEIDQYEGIPVPDLAFPGDKGNFNMNKSQIQKARNFLVNHPDAKHNYSFGDAQTNITTSPDGKELYVNGQHVNQAHTDNDGNGGQGPIVFSFQPPQEDIYQARYGQQYTGLLKKLGIPVQPKVKTINAQIPTVYVQEDFDMYAMGWALGVNMTFLAALYSSEGADLESKIDDRGKFNPMGYTGADDLIFQDLKLMDFSKRRPVVKKILATIWNDSPTNITDVANVLEPTNKQFVGWVNQLGGTITEDSFLNVHQNPNM